MLSAEGRNITLVQTRHVLPVRLLVQVLRQRVGWVDLTRHAAHVGQAKLDELLKEKEVCELIGCSKSTLWRMVGRGDFPRPYKFGQRLTRWNNYEIHIWMTELCETT